MEKKLVKQEKTKQKKSRIKMRKGFRKGRCQKIKKCRIKMDKWNGKAQGTKQRRVE